MPLLAFEFCYGSFNQFDIKFITNSRYVPGLGKAQYISAPPDLEIMHGKVQSSAKVGKVHQGLEPFFRILGKDCPFGQQQVGVCLFPCPSHPSPQLIYLSKPQPVHLVYDNCIGRGDIKA